MDIRDSRQGPWCCPLTCPGCPSSHVAREAWDPHLRGQGPCRDWGELLKEVMFYGACFSLEGASQPFSDLENSKNVLELGVFVP